MANKKRICQSPPLDGRRTYGSKELRNGLNSKPKRPVALGLVALRESDWVAGIPEGLATVRVSVTSVPIEHAVKVQDFRNWVERERGTPKEVSNRNRIRAILGLPR